MNIFKHYTGSALLNNAMMTIESRAKLTSVEEITPEKLLQLYKEYNLPKLNKRMKSYTMLFSKNGPLFNDKKIGEQLYDTLMQSILSNYENEGKYACEISGLRFQKTFSDFYMDALHSINCPQKEISKKDKTINRCWFPLVGSLGSDAQSLPQAKFAINIHPFCIALMQFLPLSAVLYKGGVLLVDSINFEFAKDFIASNVQRVKEKIESTSSDKSIDNIKDYTKGNYLLKAIDILNEKKEFEQYSDLNLWSFSNVGTGASCDIDRIPNQLVNKLIAFRRNPACVRELESFLRAKQDITLSFLNDLESDRDCSLLYPTKDHEGVSVDFLDLYHQLIGNSQQIIQAKYIAGLINKHKNNDEKFDKLLEKTDAYQDIEYKTGIYGVLLNATQKGEWNINNHLKILNNPDELPLNSSVSFSIYRMSYFYFTKKCSVECVDNIQENDASALKVLALVADMIEKDKKKDTLIKDIQQNKNVDILNLIVRNARSLDFGLVYEIFFKDRHIYHYGLLDLLRIYYHQPVQNLKSPVNITGSCEEDFSAFKEFADAYIQYYFNKYKNPETGDLPYSKFVDHVLSYFPHEYGNFLNWLEEATDNMNEVNPDSRQWDDSLLYDSEGDKTIGFSRFATDFF
jgi:hypothetical protein